VYQLASEEEQEQKAEVAAAVLDVGLSRLGVLNFVEVQDQLHLFPSGQLRLHYQTLLL